MFLAAELSLEGIGRRPAVVDTQLVVGRVGAVFLVNISAVPLRAPREKGSSFVSLKNRKEITAWVY